MASTGVGAEAETELTLMMAPPPASTMRDPKVDDSRKVPRRLTAIVLSNRASPTSTSDG